MRFLTALPLLFLLIPTAGAQRGYRITMVTRNEMPGAPRSMPTESTSVTYVLGPRIRIETTWTRPGRLPETQTLIERCDTHVMYSIDPKRHEYVEAKMTARDESQDGQQKPQTEKPNVLFDTKTVETGETKRAFGHTAHHYVTTTREIPSGDLDERPSETVEDNWYLEMPEIRSCEPRTHKYTGLIGGYVSVGGGTLGEARKMQDIRPEFRYTGPDPQGLVLSSKRTMSSIHVLQTGEKQTTKMTSSSEIVDLSEVPIDPALFEVPAGFVRKEPSRTLH
jgi:hypothetical protein